MLDLRPFQKQALATLTKPSHLICVAPTGSGKSLIYERMCAQNRYRTLLITPLIALARQQATRLKSSSIPVALYSGDSRELPEHFDFKTGTWILSPESLSSPRVAEQLERWQPDFLVVDECHCLWEWGEDFRPAFGRIPKLLAAHAIPRSLWLTATLPYDARKTLRSFLPAPLAEIGAFDLPPQLSLKIVRVPWIARAEFLINWIRKQGETAGIIFVSTRESTLRVGQLLENAGYSCLTYHAGMSHEERRNVENQIQRKLPQVIVATSAFGMGMDYAHLRWAALWQAPPSLLALAQSVGRVGRASALDARALVLWDHDDFRLMEWMIQGSERKQRETLKTLEFLQEEGCSRQKLISYFEAERCVDRPHTFCESCAYCKYTHLLRRESKLTTQSGISL